MPLRSRRAHFAALLVGAFAIGVVVLWPRTSSAPAPSDAGDVSEADEMLSAEPPATHRNAPASPYQPIPKIDVHVHLPPGAVTELSALFETHGVHMAFNASGGHPGPLLDANASASARAGGRVPPYCHLLWARVESEGWAEYAPRALEACQEAGAIGLKVFKALGLGYTLADGSLLAVDDPRLDPAFEAAGRLALPVLIHSGDPRAFFEPPTEDNERYAELSAHPSWSFHGPMPESDAPWPSWRALLGQLERRVARHPETTFVGAHFGNAPEDPAFVDRMLDTYPNYYIETGARVPEIGRHDPSRMRDFFLKHRRRILFGTDFQVAGPGAFILGSAGEEPDPPEHIPAFYEAHWRYFETDDRDFAHPTPIQGDWTIDGIDLPRDVLEDIYHRNAERVFGVRLPDVPESR